VEFTVTGLILFILGVFVYIHSPRNLSYLAIFFIPFTATAIINFSSGFWLTPFQLFGLMWLLNRIQTSLITKKALFPKQLKLYLILIYTFITVVFLSATMPMIISGNLSITSSTLGDFSTSSLGITTRNLTAPFYVFFGGIFSLLIASQNSQYENLLKSLKTLVLSSAFTSLWGLLQFASFFSRIEYPSSIFNNTANESAQHYNQLLTDLGGFSGGLIRISSVAAEPSVLAQFLIVVIPILLFSKFLKKTIFSRFIDSTILYTNIIILFLSTSASAYIGAFFIAIYSLATLFSLRLIGWRIIFLFALIQSIILYLYFRFDGISELINLYLFNKLSTGSGSERIRTVFLALSYFEKYPILGVGWGSITSFDMFIFIMSSTGFLGLLSFLGLIIYPIKASLLSILEYRELINFSGKENLSKISLFIGILISFISLLSVQTFSGFWYGYGYFWFILGLTIAIKPNILNIKNLLSPQV
jgi:hypothetical protein